MTPRAEAVEAIVHAFMTDDRTAYPMDATGEERAAAEQQIGARLAADGPSLDPRMQARHIMYRAYRPGDDWDDLFNRLSPAEIDALRRILPHLPQRAGRHFAMRFVVPGGHHPEAAPPPQRRPSEGQLGEGSGGDRR